MEVERGRDERKREAGWRERERGRGREERKGESREGEAERERERRGEEEESLIMATRLIMQPNIFSSCILHHVFEKKKCEKQPSHRLFF